MVIFNSWRPILAFLFSSVFSSPYFCTLLSSFFLSLPFPSFPFLFSFLPVSSPLLPSSSPLLSPFFYLSSFLLFLFLLIPYSLLCTSSHFLFLSLSFFTVPKMFRPLPWQAGEVEGTPGILDKHTFWCNCNRWFQRLNGEILTFQQYEVEKRTNEAWGPAHGQCQPCRLLLYFPLGCGLTVQNEEVMAKSEWNGSKEDPKRQAKSAESDEVKPEVSLNHLETLLDFLCTTQRTV